MRAFMQNFAPTDYVIAKIDYAISNKSLRPTKQKRGLANFCVKSTWSNCNLSPTKAQPTELNSKLPAQKLTQPRRGNANPFGILKAPAAYKWQSQFVSKSLQAHTSKPKLTKASGKVLPPIPSSLRANERMEGSAASSQKSQSFSHTSSWFLHALKHALYP